ncbi:uncharacterized protein TNCV_2021191 [Trichonephila clavipes]|nr:uncharacterized protein TNCV_2021191 [Trichonephila clavipes]
MQGAELSEPEVPLILRRANSIISPYLNKYTAVTKNIRILKNAMGNPGTVGPSPSHLERVEAVVRFRLITGHSFLRGYLQWLGLPTLRPCQKEWRPLVSMHYSR